MLKIIFEKTDLESMSRSDMRRIGAAAIGTAGEYWRKTYLPLHFKSTARHRYNYKSRKPSYRKSKLNRAMGSSGQRAIGEDLPLVFTGRTRKTALSNSHVNATAKSYDTYTAVVTIPAPALSFIPELIDELTRINSQEIRRLEAVFGREYERLLSRRNRKVTKKTTHRAAA